MFCCFFAIQSFLRCMVSLAVGLLLAMVRRCMEWVGGAPCMLGQRDSNCSDVQSNLPSCARALQQQLHDVWLLQLHARSSA